MPRIAKKATKPAAKKSVKTKAATNKTSKKVIVKKVTKTKAATNKTAKMKTVAVKKNKKYCDDVRSLKIWLFFVGFLLLLGLVLSNLYWSQGSCDDSCSFLPDVLQKKVIDEPESNNSVGLANPASMNCLDMNGNLEMKKRGDGGEYGVCIFPNGNECEEWALFNGDCPVEGVEVPAEGYRTSLEQYCALTGGSIDKDSYECVFSEESSCDLEDYYNGICHK